MRKFLWLFLVCVGGCTSEELASALQYADNVASGVSIIASVLNQLLGAA